MKLLQRIGSHPESANSKQTCQWGLYECPICHNEVQKPLKKGGTQKTCGSKECRKIAFRRNNGYDEFPEDRNIDVDNKKALRHMYKTDKFSSDKDATFNTFEEFYEVTNNKYAKVSNLYGSCILDKIDISKPYGASNYKFTPDNSSSIYLIQCEDYIKIGKSKSLKNRFAQLQQANPYPLKIIINIKLMNSSLVEQYLHNEYKEYNQNLEWFKLSKEQVIDIIDFLNSDKPKEITKEFLYGKSMINPIKHITSDKEDQEFISNKDTSNADKHTDTWRESVTKHNKIKHPLYTKWLTMRSSAKRIKDKYNIESDPNWIDNLDNFISDIGELKDGEESLILINPTKGYSKDNCKFGSKSEQGRYSNAKNWLVDESGSVFEGIRDYSHRALGLKKNSCSETLRTKLKEYDSGWIEERGLKVKPLYPELFGK